MALADELMILSDDSPMGEKARYFQRNLIERHLLEGLYVSIVPVPPPGKQPSHTVDEGGNVIHAGVWTGRYLAGVGYQYAVTRDSWVRKHGGEILRGLRTLQEVTGKPGLLARGYVKGHGPVEGWERNGADSAEWHQGQGEYTDYRWYGDVSVDNFNAVLYGYAVYHDLAADDLQKQYIARDVDRLMTHLLENHCRIVDVDGEVTMWGHVGVDPDPTRDDYYLHVYGPLLERYGLKETPWGKDWKPPLHASLMLLPDLLIAHRITCKPHYLEFYQRVVERFRDNPHPFPKKKTHSLESVARVNHSAEGQDYEALYNLLRYERDPELLKLYQSWLEDLWEMNWMEGHSLFTFMTLALLPEHRAPETPGEQAAQPEKVPHGEESLKDALETLRLFPVDRVFRPVMNSLRTDIEVSPHGDRGNQKQGVKPLPVNQRPLDNEYEWKSSPYRLDGWQKPTVQAFQYACDDPKVAWYVDSAGRIGMTRDGGETWRDMTTGLMGARVQNIIDSPSRTFVLWAKTDRGIYLTRDGGMSWRPSTEGEDLTFPSTDFKQWQRRGEVMMRINDAGEVIRHREGDQTAQYGMTGWRIPLAQSLFLTPHGWIGSGPGGCYRSEEGETWTELKLWPEEETGAADYLHAYWMGRYYGFIE
jgi:hypothetical protein